jgi:hypothetical protein
MISCGWIISHRCSWITVHVLCCNAEVNLIVIFMTCTCIAMHSLFCQVTNCNLFTQHVIYLYGETPLVNYGPRSIILHLYYLLLQAPFTFRIMYLFTYCKQISLSTWYVESFVYSKPVRLITSLVEKSLLVVHHFGIRVAHMGCATTATPLITVYWWRMSIYAPRICWILVAHIEYAPLVSYAWRIFLYAPPIHNAPLNTYNMRYWYFVKVQKNWYFLVFIHSNAQEYI